MPNTFLSQARGSFSPSFVKNVCATVHDEETKEFAAACSFCGASFWWVIFQVWKPCFIQITLYVQGLRTYVSLGREKCVGIRFITCRC